MLITAYLVGALVTYVPLALATMHYLATKELTNPTWIPDWAYTHGMATATAIAWPLAVPYGLAAYVKRMSHLASSDALTYRGDCLHCEWKLDGTDLDATLAALRAHEGTHQ